MEALFNRHIWDLAGGVTQFQFVTAVGIAQTKEATEVGWDIFVEHDIRLCLW